MEDLAPVLIAPTFFIIVAYIIKIISDNRIRQRLIDSGQIDEKVKYLYFKTPAVLAEPISSVRWGLVLIALGLGVLIGQQFPAGEKEQMTLCAMFIMAGLAFLVYYFLAKKELKQKSSRESEL
jgi:hypothetical protein